MTKFQKDLKYYETCLKAEADEVIQSKPLVEDYDEILAKLQKLSFISPSE